MASCGDTPDHALEELQEAVQLYLENAKMLHLLPDLDTLSPLPIASAPLSKSACREGQTSLAVFTAVGRRIADAFVGEH